MHPFRAAVAITPAEPDGQADVRNAWARDFLIGWLAGLIFFGTMLS